MKSISRILGGAALVAVLVMAAAPAAEAQCAPGQVFASIGLGTPMAGSFKQVTVATAGKDNTGKELGRFWAAADSTKANNFGGTCPSTNLGVPADSWWDLVGTDRGISGGFTVGTCLLTSCPNPAAGADQMVFLVEEWGPGGPPGVGGTAYWIALRVDGTPALGRIWDLSRVTGNPPVNTVLPFLEFPTAQVTGSMRNLSGGVDTSNDYVDIGLNIHSGTGAGNVALADNLTATHYDICTFHGPADPGRLRSAGWNCSTSVSYDNGAKTGVPFKVACPTIVDDTWVAIGVTFSGGAGPAVKSNLVGRAIRVECDPTLAEPEPVKRPGLRPATKKPVSGKPARSR
jgi:hypothetical protein